MQLPWFQQIRANNLHCLFVSFDTQYQGSDIELRQKYRFYNQLLQMMMKL